MAGGARESTLGGMCFDSTVSSEAALRSLRRQVVKFNQKKSMYRDGDIIAMYTLDRPGQGSLAGCANACLLNWRLTSDESQSLDTDCSLDENSHCPMASGILVADRKCEAFMFNRITSVCTLLSAEQSLQLTRSSNFWSGKLVCEDMSSVDDWAEGVVSRRSPPPPPPPTVQLSSPQVLGGEVFSASTVYQDLFARYAFDGLYTTYWHSACPSAYKADGTYLGSVDTLVDGQQIPGDWLQIQFPRTIRVTKFSISPRQTWGTRMPYDGRVVASTDGSTWTTIKSWLGQSGYSYEVDTYFDLSANTDSFSYYRLITEKTGGGDCIQITQWKIFGFVLP